MDELNGVIVIDKPQNMTSHDVVAILRRKLKTKKIGHTGTLDPMATGILPICIGKSTKIVDFLMDRKKGYACEMVLGQSTDTQDCWGTILESSTKPLPSKDEIIRVIHGFVGEINQIPPMYSALKVGGEKLVDLARQGIVIEREPRKRMIYSIDAIEIDNDVIRFEVICAKGTYIRTLCHDIGMTLGCFAHMTKLNRIFSEPFYLNQAISLDDLTTENVHKHIIDIESALAWMPSVRITANEKLKLQINNGVKVDLSQFIQQDAAQGLYKVYVNSDFRGIGAYGPTGLYIKKILID